jgi:pyrroline-5-carboxylate reductase
MNINGFANSTIGIVGFGHLGHSLAVPLARNGFPKERLMISHGASAATRERAISLGFADCVTDTAALMDCADVAIIAVRPQDALSLPANSREKRLLVSCMAGLPIDLLRIIFKGEVARMMCSGPDTILAGNGVATSYPAGGPLDGLLSLMGMRTLSVASEEELDAFTVGICIPAMLQNTSLSDDDVSDGINSMKSRYPVYGPLEEWIREVTPERRGDESANLRNVSTKGGVTEAMMKALGEGASFAEALRRGMERGREISDEIRKNVLEALRLAG